MSGWVAVMPFVWRPYADACLATMHPSFRDHVLVVDNTVENRGCPSSHNLGVDFMYEADADWLIILSPAIRFGAEGGRDFAEILTDHPDFYVIHAASPNVVGGKQQTEEGGGRNAVFGWHCFSPDTEVLTRDGWKPFPELLIEDQILVLDPATDISSWGPVNAIIKRPFDGFLNVISGAGSRLDFAITDDHRLYAAPRHQRTDFSLRPFSELPQTFYVKRTNKWAGSNPSERVFPAGKTCSKERRFSFEDWAAFLGWYVSEGSTGSGGSIFISQNQGEKYEQIHDLLQRMGFTVWRGANFLRVESVAISRWVKTHCGVRAENKRIPVEIKDAEMSVLDAFLDAFRKGDGSVRESGGARYYTSSARLADDLQEILCKLGRARTLRVSRKKGSVAQFAHKTSTRGFDEYTVAEGQPRDAYVNKKKSVSKEAYTGHVWCLSTPTEIFMVRRNGRPMWSGNCSAFHRRVFDTVGRWDSNFDPYGCDDLDLSLRLQKHFKGAPGWDTYPCDVSDTVMAHSINLAGIVSPYPPRAAYFTRKWGRDPADWQNPGFDHPFNDETLPLSFWPTPDDPRSIQNNEFLRYV